MTGISTHILDTTCGKPVGGIAVQLLRDGQKIGAGTTNSDGRCPALLAQPLEAGRYTLVFQLATYFPDGFYPEVTITFLVRDPLTHHHVPLLISPFGFTTYRGS